MTRKRPGRPPKYDGPIKRLQVILPYEIAKEMEDVKGEMSWSDFIIFLYFEHKRRSSGDV